MVMAGADGDEVVLVGFSAVVPGDDVVEFAGDGLAVAVGERAGLVAGPDEPVEVGGWPVDPSAVVDHFAGGVGEDPSPGAVRVGGERAGHGGWDRSVPGQLAGLIG